MEVEVPGQEEAEVLESVVILVLFLIQAVAEVVVVVFVRKMILV